MHKLIFIPNTLISICLIMYIACGQMFTSMYALVHFASVSTTEPFTTHVTEVLILICLYGLVFTQSTL